MENEKTLYLQKLEELQQEKIGLDNVTTQQKDRLAFLKNDNEFLSNLTNVQKEFSKAKKENYNLKMECLDMERFVKQNHNNIEQNKHMISNLDKKIKARKNQVKIEDISEMNKKLLDSEEKIRVYENERKDDDDRYYTLIREA